MKNRIDVMFFSILLFCAVPLTAEIVHEKIYDIHFENGAVPDDLEREMEARFEIYNRLFRFDPARLDSPLLVRVFDEKNDYDAYISERLGTVKPGAVYLHYSQAERRELVIHRGSPEEAPMLAHQAFVQFLRAFAENPPAWMREGFAIYYSTLRILPGPRPDYEENLLWLEGAKSLGDKLPRPEVILLSDAAGNTGTVSEEFQISSWAFTSFLLNGGRDYFRALTDSFMLLSKTAAAAENSLAVFQRFYPWNDFDAMARDFKNYLEARKTFTELMEDGHRAYSLGDAMNAELSFLMAMEQRPSDFAPYYYLGLLAYEAKNYQAGEQYYIASRERGADEALINYALGINAAADGRGSDAAAFLQRAASADPAKYRTRVEEILRRIGQ